MRVARRLPISAQAGRKLVRLAATAAAAVALPAVDDASAAPVRAALSQTSCAGADVQPGPATVGRARAAVLCLLNAERARRGMAPLRPDGRLRRAANRHSRHMRAVGYFDHVSPAGTDSAQRVRQAGYLRGARRWIVAENIAWGAGEAARPREIVDAWMRSPGHRRNILDRRFREVGVGVALGTPRAGTGRGATYTTNFGARS